MFAKGNLTRSQISILFSILIFLALIHLANAGVDKIRSLPAGISMEETAITLGYPYTVKTEIKENIFRLTYKICEDCRDYACLYFKDNKYLGLITVTKIDRCAEFQRLYSLGAVDKQEAELECEIYAQKINMQMQYNNMAYQQQMIEQQRWQQLYNTFNHIEERNRQIRLDEENRMQQQIENARAIYQIQQRSLNNLNQPIKRTDYNCSSDCRSMGYTYGYCQSACGY